MSIQWKLIIEYGGRMARLIVIVDGKEEQVFRAQIKKSIVKKLRKDPMYQDVLETHHETLEEAKVYYEQRYGREAPKIWGESK